MSEKRGKKTTSVLYNTFVGNVITVLVKNVRGVTGSNRTANLMMAGYLIDECETFIYLGETPDEVTAAIPKADLGPVMMGDGSVFDDIPQGSEIQ